MTLKSMTGFARGDGRFGSLDWHWEIRTLNSRGLDIRLRLPHGLEGIEASVRDACKRHFARGNCQINLSIQREASGTRARLNEQMLADIATIVERARSLVDAPQPALDGLLAMKGVIEYVEPEDEPDTEARNQELMKDLDRVLEDVVAARTAEGSHLSAAIQEQIDEIEKLVKVIEDSPARTPAAIGERLQEQISRLLQNGHEFDQQRLYQEAALLATKSDLSEELERLKAHVSAARELLKQTKPVGRRLEFLSQEFNREANTICSKSNDVDVTSAGLALKAVIDRVREQVQNIE
jgi:uncharacterized protein (TIGR00255 family)